MSLLAAVIIDLIVGDPDFYPHPVVLIGRAINYLEAKLRPRANDQLNQRLAGLILAIIIIVASFLLTLTLLTLAFRINFYLGLIANSLVLSTTIATKGLIKAGNSIFQALKDKQLDLARKRLGLIVGRDTEQMSREDVIRATVETLAENTSDGIIAPLFFAMIGGAPLAMAYKAVNTLDSMLGYKNDEYRYFGWASARIDDLANLIPARITAGLFILAALLAKKDWQTAVKTILNDAKKHPSPNAGYPEAAIAGALRIRLGGTNYYQGQKSFRAYLGQAQTGFVKEQIKATIVLIYLNLGLFLAVYLLLIAI